MFKSIRAQQGLSLVELLVAMTISLVVMIAAAYVYLSARESQRAIDRTGSSRETGAFVMQMLGHEIRNAGFYPATVAPIFSDPAQQGMYDTYPPLPSDPRVATDWQNPAEGWPPAAFQAGIFGCDGGEFNVTTSTCPTVDADAADTLVINYFTSDTKTMGSNAGQRWDCTGHDVAPGEAGAGGDPSNDVRKKNSNGSPPTQTNEAIPPQLPVFVSNRFTLRDVRVADQFQEIGTKSLVCSGNGKSPHGATDETAYQSIIAGLEDLQFAYGIHNGTSMQFHTATQIDGNAPLLWRNVTVVRVCLLTRTLGGNTRLPGAPSTYRDCNGAEKDHPAGDTITRHVEEFGLRNNMKQYY
ncbi:PilW family protein [Verminephrobacter eiseniae]|uniref:Tfp pilus assembly protein PilW-like protein n=1 Tax=Verminephrobacter eiseniae (strain EF01-2) TaxID=391735 RepID=A1WF79_VEREI|nr:PilW family protein [Verminephrobacter eiseniae]ABM56286.1 Tfp pilus assembly protein PilW-like protein [Verminephrobacter eiseniae EF01-2]MCW5286650.1 prepilin-type N-terminal cleavage/methylation domain-containing protein [Verminephrobacter eiseniae]MCW5304947.1 prepilin-type N-terminal cleavage/methylation domain-containing protein [Verminephrobacter eiseniae]MCW8181078.1 prepilin-type N-terminal cleavage/methylation domain-containing protein [Verminephrobacter eiseniae]MCW8192662.1 prep